MSLRSRVLLLGLVAASAGLQGCFFSKKPKAVQVPSPPAPAPASSPAPPSSPRPAAEKRATRPPRKKAEPPAQAAAPSSTPAPAPSVSPGQLSQILSPEEKNQLTRSLDQSTASARSMLAQSASRSLSGQQMETVKQIRTLLAQAEAARTKDLSVAAQLARRAELLARDLATSLR